MDCHGNSLDWHIPKRKTESQRLSALDGLEYSVFRMEFRDWGICPSIPVPLLPISCCLWIFCLEKPEVELE